VRVEEMREMVEGLAEERGGVSPLPPTPKKDKKEKKEKEKKKRKKDILGSEEGGSDGEAKRMGLRRVNLASLFISAPDLLVGGESQELDQGCLSERGSQLLFEGMGSPILSQAAYGESVGGEPGMQCTPILNTMPASWVQGIGEDGGGVRRRGDVPAGGDGTGEHRVSLLFFLWILGRLLLNECLFLFLV
jgi:hypothetical protein